MPPKMGFFPIRESLMPQKFYILQYLRDAIIKTYNMIVKFWWVTYIKFSLRGWGPDSGPWGRFMKAVKLFSDPTKTKIYKRVALWSA